MKTIISVMIFCLVPMVVVSGQEQQAQKMLSEAVYQEEINGDLDEAIKIYQLVINQYPDNRNVCAEAYLHLGMCYEKLGRQDAMNAYREVIDNYGEQKDIVAKARERLSSLKQPMTKPEEPEGLKIRQIWRSRLLNDLGTVSYDGRFRSYVDWGLGNVGIHNLITDEKKVLTDDANLGESWQYALNTVISQDGKRIAYSWSHPYNTTALRLIDVDNPEPARNCILLHGCLTMRLLQEVLSPKQGQCK